ncbi:carbohydrate ABC transporter permease [Jonesia quinghaiensis]|uniref:carbohydrate ABC transporter permease n=1 Tax=Jonesia quinghaiensis TaxID=262806 RepID=UPI00041460CD|nr:sugar ABC transporter permease [Jonesia quinghaiensis]
MAVQSPPKAPKNEGNLVDRRPTRIAFSQKLGRWDVKVSPYLYISPFFILFAITGLFPLIYTGYISVHQWHTLGGQGDFVGLQNFQDVLDQSSFWKALRNTFSIFLISSVPQIIAAITIAAILNANLRAKTFWRMGVLLPYIVAPIAVGLIFGQIFADQYGLANGFLNIFGIEPIRWHAEVLPSHVAIATMVNFRWTGYNTLIFLAAMQAIPSDLYEAAIIDGAGRFRQFFSITIPQLRATIIFVVITSTIGGLQIFDEARAFDAQGTGGADKQWLTLTMYIHELGWGNQLNFGRAAAVAWLLFLIIVAIGILNFFITSKIATSGGSKPKKFKKVGKR